MISLTVISRYISEKFKKITDHIIDIFYNPEKVVKIVKGIITNRISRYFVEIDKDSYTVHYPYGVRWYRIRIPKITGPSPMITRIVDLSEEDTEKEGIDITEHIKPLLGPSHNFHNQPVSPEDLGYKKIRFEFALDDDKTFVNDDTIVI